MELLSSFAFLWGIYFMGLALMVSIIWPTRSKTSAAGSASLDIEADAGGGRGGANLHDGAEGSDGGPLVVVALPEKVQQAWEAWVGSGRPKIKLSKQSSGKDKVHFSRAQDVLGGAVSGKASMCHRSVWGMGQGIKDFVKTTGAAGVHLLLTGQLPLEQLLTAAQAGLAETEGRRHIKSCVFGVAGQPGGIPLMAVHLSGCGQNSSTFVHIGPDVTIGGLHTLFAGLRGGLPEADFGEDQLHDLMAAGGGPTIHWFITSAAWALGVDGELALDWARLEWTALPAPVAELAE